MNYHVIWFILWGVLWAAYFMLDGFDLGAGILYPFLGRDEAQKAAIRGSIGPVWDGNEVWLVTAGGATFAAFPAAYARLFSELYLAMLLILFGLIFRGVSLEFRSKGESPGWKRLWDDGFFLGSLVPALLFGVAFGNLFRGLPLDAKGYHGTLFTLLNPYGLLTGLLFVLLFLVHGSLWIALRGGDDLREVRAARRFGVVRAARGRRSLPHLVVPRDAARGQLSGAARLDGGARPGPPFVDFNQSRNFDAASPGGVRLVVRDHRPLGGGRAHRDLPEPDFIAP